MSEAELKARLRKIVGGWSESYEPGRGSGVGYPDLQFLLGNRLLPVEVKQGFIQDGRIHCDRIRPSQINWHDNFLKNGGLSFVFALWGQRNEFTCWCLPLPYRYVTMSWRSGFPEFLCRPIVTNARLVIDLSTLLETPRN